MDSTLTLTADTLNYFHQWSTGDTTVSTDFTPVAPGHYDITCRTYRYEILSTNNLMANGDFENYVDYNQAPSGFSSDYTYVPFSPYATGLYAQQWNGQSGVYLLSNNANHTWQDYAPVKPHGGNFFAMFDAAAKGYAWKVTTNDNPGMELQKDGKYVFSYWAADLNQDFQDQHPAQLQFSIAYRDTLGVMQKEYLGQPMQLGGDNKWHFSQTFWFAPCNSDYIEIGVEDLNPFSGVGNDFALDDIIFQMVTNEITVEVNRETFPVDVVNCAPCEKVIYSKWNDVLFVDNHDDRFVSYQWFCDGVPMSGETGQFLYQENGLSTGAYSCVMMDIDGNEVEACETTFSAAPRSVEQTGLRSSSAKKTLTNGALRIQRAGRTFNILGQLQ